MNPYFLIQKKQISNKILIVLFGESNSGGRVLNSECSSQDLQEKTIKIFNNGNSIFEPLQIGVNNLINHFRIPNNTEHSMELELSNKYDDGYFVGKEVLLLKSGQGGSKVSEWQIGGSYFNTLKSRIDTAISSLSGENLDVIFMLSLGINDSLAATTSADFKKGLKTLIQNLQNYFSFPINLSLMKFEFVTSAAANCYATQIDEVATELGMKTFSTAGCAVLPDGNHLTYSAMKTATNNFLNSL